MFRIAVQTGGPEEMYGIDGGYRAIAEAGFDAVDANVDHLLGGRDIHEKRLTEAFLAEGKECLEYFRPWKEAAEKYGLDNYQAHAPFPSHLPGEDGAFNEVMIEVLNKTIMGCDYMNCRNLVVHPFFQGYGDTLSEADEWELNIRRYAQLIPAAKEYGVTVCLENMFGGYRGKLYSACCSDFDVACRYVDELNRLAGEQVFGFCLDVGHALLLGKDIRKAMIQLGHRITAFHVHDNDGARDQHLAPYMGVMDWNRFVDGLRDIGFNRTLSFETFNVFNVVDPELCPDMLRLIAKTGRMFARRAAE